MSHSPRKTRDHFNTARAEALNAYALLEKGLALLFATALSTDPRYATLTISKIINTRARNEVVQRVVNMSTVNAFKAFTNSLFVLIGQCDSERNKLVHWYVEEKHGQIALRPTDLLTKSDDRMTADDINALWAKCLFLCQLVSKFDAHQSNWAHDPALHERFLQPLRYPPEPDDPLFPSYKDIVALPRPLQA
ncbi:MAG: hypothetical protein WKF52_05620 [Sphingomicrobium sp.]